MAVRVKWIGNAFFTIQSGDRLVFTDPWVTNNPGATLTVEEAAALSPTHVLVSHGHPGHYGRGDSVEIANRAQTTYYSTIEVIRYVLEKNLLKVPYVGLAPGSHIYADGVEFEMFEVKHPPEPPLAPEWAEVPAAPNTINRIKIGGKTLLHVGDTLPGPVYEKLAAEGRIDLAMLPLWGKGMAFGEEEAIQSMTEIIKILKPRYVMFHNRWDPERPGWNSFFKANEGVDFGCEFVDQHPGTEVEL